MSWERILGVHPLALVLTFILTTVSSRAITSLDLDLIGKALLLSHLITVLVCTLAFEFLSSSIINFFDRSFRIIERLLEVGFRICGKPRYVFMTGRTH